MISRRTLLKSALLLPLLSECTAEAACAQGSAPQDALPPAASMGSSGFEKLCRKYVGLGLPAVWVSVTDRGRFLSTACAGYRDIDGRTPAGLLDCVGYGSITKTFTGLMIATLVAEGTLSYDRPVVDYLADIADAFSSEQRKITLGQLVTHMAGLQRAPPEPTQHFEDGTAYRRQYALNGLAQPLLWPVGTAYGYSNTGITIAALAAERVTGKPWGQLIRERVTVPLKLTSICAHPAVDDKLVHSYKLGPSGLVDTIDEKVIQRNRFGPAGSLRGTVSDLMKFGAAFLNAESLPPPIAASGIYPLLIHAAARSTATYCAMGYSKGSDGGVRIAHSGSLDAGRYRAYAKLRVNFNQGRSVAIMTNVSGDGPEYSKRVSDLIVQMNNEVERYF